MHELAHSTRRRTPARAPRHHAITALLAALALLMLPSLAHADTRSVDLLTAANIHILGGDAQDHAGTSVAPAGDVNGDGVPDLIVGAPEADATGRTDSGSAYVIYGATSMTNVDLGDLGTHGFRIDGAADDDGVGEVVDGAGDVNGDGVDDVIVGSDVAGDGYNGIGLAYVVFGQKAADPADVDLASLGSRGFRIGRGPGEDEIDLGAVYGAGDVNGDGLTDVLVVGTVTNSFVPTAWVVYGRSDASPPNVDLGNLGSAGFEISDSTTSAWGDNSSGAGDPPTAAAVGDLNGDGIDDIAFALDEETATVGQFDDGAFVVYGQNATDPADVDLHSLGSRGMRIGVDQNTDGPAVVTVGRGGDFNGDGVDDVAVGEPYAQVADNPDAGSGGDGVISVVYGQNQADPADVDASSLGARGARIEGAEGDLAGEPIASAGDLNGDGAGDLIIGAPGDERPGDHLTGSNYVVYGQPTADPADARLEDLGDRGYRIHSDTTDVASFDGSNLAGADVNDDGLADVGVGLTGDSTNGTGAGAVYMLASNATPPAVSIDDAQPVIEGDSGQTDATFTVSLSAASSRTVTVDYATHDGTATAPSDYDSASGAVSFAPGETSKQITVKVNGDTEVEGDESFTVALSSPVNASVGAASGTGTIIDDDVAAPPGGGSGGGGGGGSPNPPPPLPPPSGPLIARAVLHPGQATTQQRDFTLDVTCSVACRAQPGSGTLSFTSVHDAATLQRYESDSGFRASHDIYGQTFNVTYDGAAVDIGAGQTATLHGTLPLDVQGPVSSVLRHGGAVRMTVNAQVANADQQTTAGDTKVLVEGGAGPARRADSGSVVTLQPLKLVGRFETYQIAITGRQVTTWSYHHQEADANGCQAVSDGHGTQVIDFTAGPAQGRVGAFHLDGPMGDGRLPVEGNVALYGSEDGHAPLELAAALSVSRDGHTSSTATCGVAGGGGKAPDQPDCGRRMLSGLINFALRPETFLTGNQWDRYTAHGTPDSEIYADCPFEGYSQYVSGLDLLPTLDRALSAKDLHGPGAPAEGETKHVTATDGLTRALDGGSSTTRIVWHIDLTRTGTVVCHQTGGNVTVCIDQKRKQQAQKDAQDYEKTFQEISDISKIDGCDKNHAPAAPGSPEGQAFSGVCNQLNAAMAYNLAMKLHAQSIAADPPDRHYRRIARAKPVKLPHIPHAGRAVRRLQANESKTLGLLDALMTTINRATGAKRAGNARAVRRQNAAGKRDARQLASLFSSQRRLLGQAMRELSHGPKKTRHLIPGSLARRQGAAAQHMASLLRAVARQRITPMRAHHRHAKRRHRR